MVSGEQKGEPRVVDMNSKLLVCLGPEICRVSWILSGFFCNKANFGCSSIRGWWGEEYLLVEHLPSTGKNKKK
jgi:hypothetical protein